MAEKTKRYKTYNAGCKKTEESPKKSVSSIIDNSLVGVFQSNTSGKVLFMNKPLLKMLGYRSVDDINTRGGARIFYKDPKERDEIVSLLDKKHSVEDYELEFISKAGKPIFVYLCMRMKGDILSGTIVNITKLKTAENNLQKAKGYSEMLLTFSPTAIFTVDLKGRITRWNKRDHEITGYSGEEAIGKSCTLFMDSPCKDKCGLYSPDVKKPVICRECTLIRKDGQKRIVLKSADFLIGENGNIIGGIESLEDITERKQTEDALKKSEEDFRNTFEQSAVGISRVGLDGRWIFINQRYCDIVGYSHDELVKKAFKDITHPEDIKIDYGNFLRLMNKEISYYKREKRYIRKDGSIVWVDLTVSAIYDPSGNVKYLVAVVEDINERKKAEMELQRNTEWMKLLLGLVRLRRHTLKEITGYALEACVAITKSKGGFFHFYDEEKKEITLNTWSKDVFPECSVNQDQHYPLDKAGIWADCIRFRKPVIFNDYQNEPGKKGYPEGHFRVNNFICIPIFENDKIVMICGVGNKTTPYGQSDIDDITLFMSSSWAVIKEFRAEEELRNSESRFRELFDNMDNCVAVYEAKDNGNDFIFKDFNKAAEKVEKIKKEELIGKSVLKIFPGIKEFGLFGIFREVWETGVPQSYPMALYQDQRISGWRENFVYRLPTGEIVAIYSDVTERRKAEEQLLILSKFPSENPYPVLRINKNCEILYKNPAAIKLLQKTGLTEKDIFNIIPDNLSYLINRTIKGKKTIRDVEVVIGDKIYSYTLAPVSEQNYVNLYGVDVTERKKIEIMKENAFREISHELKTPIAMIEMAQDINRQAIKTRDISQIKKTQNIISGNISRLHKDVNNILNMFVLKRKGPLKKEQISLKKILKEIIINMQYLFYEKELKIKIDIPGNEDKIFADQEKIKIVLNNIIDNAVKFTENGTISVSVKLTGKFTRIAVKDTGCGIALELQKNLFTHFLKRHPAVPGTGLGLSISKEIVELHNGKIEVFSKGIGKGTIVTVYLPKNSI